MRLNLPQRIAVLVALGVALHLLCQAILLDDEVDGTWSAYPQSGSILQSPLAGTRFSTVVELGVFALHAGAWLAAALWLLRDRD